MDAETDSKVTKFIPRQNVSIDLKINSILKVMKIKNLPIFNIQNKLFFVGLYKLELDIIGDFLVVKIGKKDWQRFASYLKANYEKFIDRLVLLSIKNGGM